MDTTRSTYDHIAGRFAQLTAAMPAPVACAARALLDRLAADGLLLDLGCGPGRDLAWFEAQGARAIGADFSAGMLAEARKRTGFPLLQMDMRRLGFHDGSMQGIWCNAALLHLPRSEAALALKEMRRVLAPGGLLDLSVQQGSGEGCETASYADLEDVPRYFARYALDEMSGMISQAGFRVLHQDVTPDGAKTWLHYVARRNE